MRKLSKKGPVGFPVGTKIVLLAEGDGGPCWVLLTPDWSWCLGPNVEDVGDELPMALEAFLDYRKSELKRKSRRSAAL